MSQLKVNSIVDAAGGSSAVLYGVASPPNSMGFRNRIINGEMRIDQRNNGASVTVGSGSTAGSYIAYPVDRFMAQSYSTTTGNGATFTAQQNAGAVTPPAGFSNYVGATVTSAQATLQNSSVYRFVHRFEGLNIADFGWGTAAANPVTLSFWVRSSVTGTFTGCASNAGASNAWRAYPFAFAISAANTWEQKTITIPGDTTGTWLKTNGNGLELSISFGASTNFAATAGAWVSSEAYAATGGVNLMATAGATFYITGVQLEAGTVATPFERRDYGRELMMCQRYYEKSYNTNVTPGTNTHDGFSSSPATGFNANLWGAMVRFNVTKRANPSVSVWSYLGTVGKWHYGVASQSEGLANILIYVPGMSGFTPYMTSAATGQNTMYGHWAATSEL